MFPLLFPRARIRLASGAHVKPRPARAGLGSSGGNPINFLLSGATTLFGTVFFPVEQLPERVRWVADFLPVTWSLRIIRGGLLQGKSFSELQRELFALALLTLILLPLGVYLSRFAIRRAKREGTLVKY